MADNVEDFQTTPVKRLLKGEFTAIEKGEMNPNKAMVLSLDTANGEYNFSYNSTKLTYPEILVLLRAVELDIMLNLKARRD